MRLPLLASLGYSYVREAKSWADARAYCQASGGELASIHSAEDNAEVYALIQRNSDFHASHGRYPGTWIGFNDKAREGTWVWSDGSPTDYVNFQSGEPNSGAAENCVFFYSGHGDEWADVACSQEQGFVCKQAGSGDSGVCEYAQCSHLSLF